MASVNLNYSNRVPFYILAFIATILLFSPKATQARELIGEKLDFYGTLHGSIDYMDSDVNDQLANADPNDRFIASDMNISSNTTKLGIKGRLRTDNSMDFLYQVEQFVDLDSEDRIDFSTRNTYLGIAGSFGQVLVGRHDSPFKLVSSRYSILTDTVGDRRAILGASSASGNRMNLRADNMILWRHQKETASGSVDWMVQYSPNANNDTGIPNNNDLSMWGVWGQWRADSFSAVIAHDSWAGIYGGEIDATRVAARKTHGAFTSALLFEHINHDLAGEGQGLLDRNAWGANLTYTNASWKYSFQVLTALSHAVSPDSGARMISLAAEKTIHDSLTGYVAYTQTDNEQNASYQAVDGGHGDELSTLPGGTPRALSVGLKYQF